MNRKSLDKFIDSYGRALSTRQLDVIVESWDLPALVMSDEGALCVDDEDQIRAFLGKAVSAYQGQGQASTQGEILGAEYLTANVIAIDVRWPSFDTNGALKAIEMSHYLIRIGKDDKPRIQVALTRSVS